MEKKNILSKAQIARVAKQNGAVKVGKDAVEVLVDHTEQYIAAVVSDAQKIAQHANRTIVRGDDIKFVLGIAEE